MISNTPIATPWGNPLLLVLIKENDRYREPIASFLSGERLSIGRDATCGIVIGGIPALSKVHCTVRTVPGNLVNSPSFTLEDGDGLFTPSKWGIRINGEKFSSIPLHHGTRVQVLDSGTCEVELLFIDLDRPRNDETCSGEPAVDPRIFNELAGRIESMFAPALESMPKILLAIEAEATERRNADLKTQKRFERFDRNVFAMASILFLIAATTGSYWFSGGDRSFAMDVLVKAAGAVGIAAGWFGFTSSRGIPHPPMR